MASFGSWRVESHKCCQTLGEICQLASFESLKCCQTVGEFWQLAIFDSWRVLGPIRAPLDTWRNFPLGEWRCRHCETSVSTLARNFHLAEISTWRKMRPTWRLRQPVRLANYDGPGGHWWYSVGYGYLFHRTGQPAFIASGSNINSHYVSKV